jgi:uncharacterized protein (DUF1501 family)
MAYERPIFPRRTFLGGVGGAVLAAGPARAVLADAPTDKRFVFITLRGAMDGLNVVPPHADPNYAVLRGQIAIARPGASGGATDLNGFFGLHPALSAIAPWYKEGALLPIQAVASPYRDRSHFDGQDVMENGLTSPLETSIGWLNRTLSVMGGSNRQLGLAVGLTIPLVLQGPIQVASWAPSKLAEPNANFLSAVEYIYQGDTILAPALADGIEQMQTDGQLLGGGGNPSTGDYKNQTILANAAGKLLADPNGPRIAVLDAEGWDTHVQQGAATGRLANALGGLSATLVALRASLGPVWKETVVLMSTEFGRTAHANGTGGTDHGTATVTLLAGGAILGGKVLGKWPGLSETSLYQSRDLMPTTDLRAVIKTVLRNHLGVSQSLLESTVFPNSADAKPIAGIIA